MRIITVVDSRPWVAPVGWWQIFALLLTCCVRVFAAADRRRHPHPAGLLHEEAPLVCAEEQENRLQASQIKRIAPPPARVRGSRPFKPTLLSQPIRTFTTDASFWRLFNGRRCLGLVVHDHALELACCRSFCSSDFWRFHHLSLWDTQLPRSIAPSALEPPVCYTVPNKLLKTSCVTCCFLEKITTGTFKIKQIFEQRP